MNFYTIGMAGHIDHGKTSLTKALTNVDTDRLKEEKERNISIELGYAPFPLDEFETSIVDVPGHEKFIRQMIAGVAGIDLVIMVIAADEGVMPQTREHMEILSFLGIKHGMIAVTKVDLVETDFIEYIEEDIKSNVRNTVFENWDIVFVDSLTGTGLIDLKAIIKEKLSQIPTKNNAGTFRLPIDQVFTLQGQGTVVRGTIYEGSVAEGDTLTIMPHGAPVKVRKIQVHNQEKLKAIAGQRAAINLSHLPKEAIKRGDVLVESDSIRTSLRIDVSLNRVHFLRHPIKQRAPVKFYTGTVEVMGKIIFFDRNELNQDDQESHEEILCQIQLEEPVIVKRGDRFVIRRPSPIETLGGGWVINPLGEKYRYGLKTIEKLNLQKAGSPEERIGEALHTQSLMTQDELLIYTSLDEEVLAATLSRLLKEVAILVFESKIYISSITYEARKEQLFQQLRIYHDAHPMQLGMQKAECIQAIGTRSSKKLAELLIDREIEIGTIVKNKQYISMSDFKNQFPPQWKSRIEQVLKQLQKDDLHVQQWTLYLQNEKIPDKLWLEIKHYILQEKLAYSLDENHLIHGDVFDQQLQLLRSKMSNRTFNIKEAKEALNVSRKNLVLFLELLDRMKITQRIDDQRQWITEM